MNKKIYKIILNFIPNKNLRKKLRKVNNQIELKKDIEYIKSEKGKKKLEKIKESFPKVLTISEILNEILINKKSIARFGDGELNILLYKKSYTPYQTTDENLKKRLSEILKYGSDEKILVCIIPFDYSKDLPTKTDDENFLERYWIKNFLKLKAWFKNNIYGNAYISRKHFFYENKVEEIKKLWENKHVIFVYSKEGRFEKDGRIFSNILSYEEILISAVNAFNEYESILKKCLEKEKNSIFIIAAGPMATVLAYDLAKEGYQALDLGHFPNCFKEFLREAPKPEELPIIKN